MKYLLAIICSLIFARTVAQDSVYRVHIGHSIANRPTGLYKLSNNKILITGGINYDSLSTNFSKAVLISTNQNGIIEWAKQYHVGTQSLFNPWDVFPFGDTLLVSFNRLNSSGFFSVVANLDSNGNIISQIEFDQKIKQITKSKIANKYWGAIESFTSPNNDISIVRLDSAFNIELSYRFELPGRDEGLSGLLPTIDGGCLLAYEHLTPVNYIPSGVIVKFDSSGNLNWAYQYDGGTSGSISDIKALPDGGFLICGYSKDPNQGKCMLFKIDSFGNVIWEHIYSLTGDCNSVSFTNDEGFIISGDANYLGSYLTFLLKTDSLGNPEWMNFSGNSGNPVGVEQTADGGYLYEDTGGDGNVLLIDLVKTDSLGNKGCFDNPYPIPTSHPSLVRTALSYTQHPLTVTISPGTVMVDTSAIPDSLICAGVTGIASHNQNIAGLEIFPNPAFSTCTVTAPSFHNSTLTLYDITGRALLQQSLNEKETLDVSKLKAGIYLVVVRDREGRVLKGKMIME